MTPSAFIADARAFSTLEGCPGSEQTASQTEPRVFSMSTCAPSTQLAGSCANGQVLN